MRYEDLKADPETQIRPKSLPLPVQRSVREMPLHTHAACCYDLNYTIYIRIIRYHAQYCLAVASISVSQWGDVPCNACMSQWGDVPCNACIVTAACMLASVSRRVARHLDVELSDEVLAKVNIRTASGSHQNR